jgi:hypothetical protein
MFETTKKDFMVILRNFMLRFVSLKRCRTYPTRMVLRQGSFPAGSIPASFRHLCGGCYEIKTRYPLVNIQKAIENGHL